MLTGIISREDILVNFLVGKQQYLTFLLVSLAFTSKKVKYVVFHPQKITRPFPQNQEAAWLLCSQITNPPAMVITCPVM